MVLIAWVALAGIGLLLGRTWWIVRRHPNFVIRRFGEKAGEALAHGNSAVAAWVFDAAEMLLPVGSALLVEARAQNHAGMALSAGGRHVEAIPRFTRARELFDRAGDVDNAVVVMGNLADAFGHAGDKARAVALLTDALELIRKTGNRAIELQTLSNLGAIYANAADPLRAEATLRQALALIDASTDPSLVQSIHLNMASIALAVHDYGSARTSLEAAELAVPGMPCDKAEYHHAVGTLLDHVGDYDGALAAYQRALDRTRRDGNPVLEGVVLNAVGRVYNFQNNPRAALDCFLQSLLLRRKGSPEEGITLDGMASSHMLLGDFDAARETYDRALVLRRASADKSGAATTIHNLGYLAVKQRDAATARQWLNEALDIRTQIGDTAGQAVTLRVLGLLAAGDGDDEEAARCFVESLDARERLRASARFDDLQLALEDDSADSYVRALGSLVRLGRTTEAFAISERARARVFIERIARSASTEATELVEHDIAPLNLPDIQQALDPDLTLVSFMDSDEHTYAFVVTRTGFECHRLETDYKLIGGLMNQVRQSAGNPTAAQRKLYDCLVRPYAASLKTDRLAFATSFLLHYVPFAALLDGEAYLGDRHALSSVPSASALVYLQRKRRRGPISVLALAYGEAEGLPKLHFVNGEVDAIKAAVPAARVEKGPDAKESVVHRDAGNYAVLHLAAHAEFDWDRPLRSRVVLSPGEQHDGSLTAEEVYQLRLSNTRLVVLSACDTSVGASSGFETLALSRAFSIAGAGTVVATLWEVDDRATGDLMAAFYRSYPTARTVSHALQQAQQDARSRYPLPYYWAGFTVFGDGGAS